MFRNGANGNKYQRASEFYHIPNTAFGMKVNPAIILQKIVPKYKDL